MSYYSINHGKKALKSMVYEFLKIKMAMAYY